MADSAPKLGLRSVISRGKSGQISTPTMILVSKRRSCPLGQRQRRGIDPQTGGTVGTLSWEWSSRLAESINANRSWTSGLPSAAVARPRAMGAWQNRVVSSRTADLSFGCIVEANTVGCDSAASTVRHRGPRILATVLRSDYRSAMLKGVRFKLHFGPYRAAIQVRRRRRGRASPILARGRDPGKESPAMIVRGGCAK